MIDQEEQFGNVSMSLTDYIAIEHACDHTARALSAARTANPFDSSALLALDRVRHQLTSSLQALKAIKARGRVMP